MQKERNSLLSLDLLNDIRSNLPHGSLTILAKKHGFTRQYVSLVFKGAVYNKVIIDDAIDMALNERKRREKERKRLKEKIELLNK